MDNLRTIYSRAHRPQDRDGLRRLRLLPAHHGRVRASSSGTVPALRPGSRDRGERFPQRKCDSFVEKCNSCALCPCPTSGRISSGRRPVHRTRRAEVRRAHRRGRRAHRQTVWSLSGLANRALRSDLAGGMIKEALGIHRDRKMPEFPKDSFTAWVRKKRLNVEVKTTTAARLPTSPAARPGISSLRWPGRRWKPPAQRHRSLLPEQKCCGMPSFLEGDRKLTMESASHNLNVLADALQDGYDLLCSCPTCSFMPETSGSRRRLTTRPNIRIRLERTPSSSRCRPKQSPGNFRRERWSPLTKPSIKKL